MVRPTVSVRCCHGVPAPGHGGHRRGLGHAVADGHVHHVHLRDDPVHDLDGAQRSGHDAGAERGEVVGGEIGQRQFGDEHGGHAVQRRSAEVLHRLQRRGRREPAARDDGRRAVAERVQVSDHHAEAVVERHRNHHAVVLRVPQQLADRVAVVEDVVVGQGGALGEARGARGVLQVDGVVRVQFRHAGLQAGMRDVVRPLEQFGVRQFRARFRGRRP